MKNVIKHTRILIYALLLTAGFTSCIFIHPDQPATRGTESRDYSLSAFKSIKAGDAIRLRVIAGPQYSVKATGELNDLDDLDLSVNNTQQLEIRYKNSWKTRERMDMTITMPDLKEINLSSATGTISGFSVLSNLSVNLSGASEVLSSGKITRLTVDISGGSLLTIDGTGETISGDISGASEFRAYDFPAKDAYLNLSGGSLAWVNISNLLKVKGSWASTVRYKGNPTIQSDLSGGSRVDKYIP